jgi:hypothetical protein
MHCFLVSASFVHPVTQRPLLSVEIVRLARLSKNQGGTSQLSDLLLVTWKHRDRLRQTIEQRRSLYDFWEGEVSAKWTSLFNEVDEDTPEETFLIEVWEEYAMSVMQLRVQSWGTNAVPRLLQVHREQLQRYKPSFQPATKYWITSQLSDLTTKFPQCEDQKSDGVAVQVFIHVSLASLRRRTSI